MKGGLTTRLAMNRVALGDFENARVDIKRTHEREGHHCRVPRQGNPGG